MKIALTGHRPKDLTNVNDAIASLSELYARLKPEVVITGMADGWDLLGGNLAVDNDIPIICAIPYWTHIKQHRDDYTKLLDNAQKIVIVTPGPYHVYKLHKRNEWMVDNSDAVIACWNGSESGGTFACIEYVNRVSKPWIRIDPNGSGFTVERSWHGLKKLQEAI